MVFNYLKRDNSPTILNWCGLTLNIRSSSEMLKDNDKNYIKVLESIQSRARKLLPGLEDMSCDEGLRTFGFPSQEERRLRGDPITLCNFLSRVGVGLWFLGTDGRMCENSTKLYQGRFGLYIRSNSFSVRVVNHWNRLPREVVDAP